MTPDQLARLFHETYERLAPEFGYRTREASAKPWAEVPEQNRALMVATCAEVLAALTRQPAGQSCRDPECGCPASRGGEPDVWQYAMPDPDEPSGLTVFDGTPRRISPRWVRRPLRAVGPWLPVPDTEEDK